MNQLNVIEQNNQRVLTTAQLAESYGTTPDKISYNFNYNEKRYTSGKHFFLLTGEDLKSFKEANREFQGSINKLYLWTEKGAWLHAKSLNTDQAWDAYELLVDDYYRLKQSEQNVPVALKESFEMQLIGVDYAARILRTDETSKIRMLEAAHRQYGVPTNHLPAYVDDEVTQSLSALLKEHGIGIGAAKMNTRLIELGILEIKERLSSKGGTKEFKSLTEKGEWYGKNLISPNNSKETQPHYYPSKFAELLSLLNSEVA